MGAVSVKAVLALESGDAFEGLSFGAAKDAVGEVVFCTALMGYQEVLTDPSYQGQIVVMTYPHIGNYGVHADLMESRKPFVAGFVAREFSPTASHWQAPGLLEDFMKKHGVPGVHGIDTRALVRVLRTKGALRGVIGVGAKANAKALVARAKASPSMAGANLVDSVTCEKAYQWKEAGDPAATKRVVVMDFGVKHNILRSLAKRGMDVTVVPASATVKDILSHKPDGVMLSNGPGDPAVVTDGIRTIRDLIAHNEAGNYLPVFGICLGHQLTGLALGGKTFKLPFGHRGANHPVKDLTTGKVEVTTQNHGFCVDIDSLAGKDVELTHVNLNDNTLEGLRHKKLPVFCVQYHPESFPGPHDSAYLFDRFAGMMNKS
jgi:carbamoyl-phosphate synthase small subunit